MSTRRTDNMKLLFALRDVYQLLVIFLLVVRAQLGGK